jgi:hypothetical protein
MDTVKMNNLVKCPCCLVGLSISTLEQAQRIEWCAQRNVWCCRLCGTEHTFDSSAVRGKVYTFGSNAVRGKVTREAAAAWILTK